MYHSEFLRSLPEDWDLIAKTLDEEGEVTFAYCKSKELYQFSFLRVTRLRGRWVDHEDVRGKVLLAFKTPTPTPGISCYLDLYGESGDFSLDRVMREFPQMSVTDMKVLSELLTEIRKRLDSRRVRHGAA